MDHRSGTTGEPVGEPNVLPRQRWRLVLARSADAPELAGRDLADAWEQAIASSGLPLQRGSGSAKARVAWGAPLSGRMGAERELVEIVLHEALPVWHVREALIRCLPAGWSLVDLHDVWLGAPALAGRVTGAVYRVALDGDAPAEAVAAAALRLLEAGQLVRTRTRGSTPVAYDLRPLLAGIDVVQPGPPVVIRVETRIHPERGSGRPEEVVAALADGVGRPLAPAWIVRERLIVTGEPG